MSELLTMEKALGLVAQCWCEPETSEKEMDATLAEAFARKLMNVVNTRPVTPLQAAKEAFIEAYGKYKVVEASDCHPYDQTDVAYDFAMEAWNHLQQIEGDSSG